MILLFLAGIASAQENARLPFQQIYKMQTVQAKWKRTQPDFRVNIRMASTNTNVKTSDLRVFIDAKKGPIPVNLGPDGSFTLPDSDELREENPWIVVNQPRGTMALHWDVEFATVPQLNNPIHYRRLLDSLFDAEDLQDEMLRAFPGGTRLIFAGLKLTFPKDTKDAAVVIHARNGDQTVKLEADNSVIIRRDAALLEQDPDVSLPARPTRIEFAVKKTES